MGGIFGLSDQRRRRRGIDELAKRYSIVHLRGKGKLNPALEGNPDYRQFEYVEDGLNDIFAAADLALSRSGANAILNFLH